MNRESTTDARDRVENPSTESPTSNEPKLIAGLGSRWAWRGEHLLLTAILCGIVVLLNHLPLRNTDLWGHVVYGRFLLDQRFLPTNDLLEPLAEGMRVVDVHWLSQLTFAAVERKFGAEGLVGLFTIVIGATYLLVARTAFLLTRSPLVTAAVTAGTFLVGWNRVTTIRPENFGTLLFAAILWQLVGRRLRRADSILADDVRGDWKLWLGIPLIACLWANLHGSFPLVVGTLGCFLLGRVLETFRHERSLLSVLADREVRRLLIWTELAFAATLVNPYLIDAWIEAVRFSSNANLREILEWNPLILVGPGGREFAAACLALTAVWRASRKPIAVSDVVLLLAFGTAALLQVRMTGWFAIVWGISVAPHLADVVLRSLRKAPTDDEASEKELDTADPDTPALRYRYTLGCFGVIWISFCFTTFSVPLIGGEARTTEALFGSTTPLRVGEWLKTQSLEGQAYSPQYWGDWLGFIAPPGMKLFASTNVHLLPRTVWVDYQRLTRAETGWDMIAEKYAIRTMIVDKREQAALHRVVRLSPDWTVVYEDEQAYVARRKNRNAPTTTAHHCGGPASHVAAESR